MRDHWNGFHVVLASASPRRKELLAQLGICGDIRPSHVEEETQETKPDQIVMDLSRQKAEDVASGCSEGTMVIGADTVVAVGNEILGKPGTPMRACEMIQSLQGRSHQVYTGVTVLLCLGGGITHGVTFAERTEVHVYPMTFKEIKAYADCGESLDKAGAYGIQGKFAAYIKGIEGDYSNVVGLPLGRLCQEVKRLVEDREDD